MSTVLLSILLIIALIITFVFFNNRLARYVGMAVIAVLVLFGLIKLQREVVAKAPEVAEKIQP